MSPERLAEIRRTLDGFLGGPPGWTAVTGELLTALDEVIRERDEARAMARCQCGRVSGWHREGRGACIDCSCVAFGPIPMPVDKEPG